MRRSDREITDRQQLLQVMEGCSVCRLALHDGDYPYILPLNFGMEVQDGAVILYFHGAGEGKKHRLMAQDNRAAFEMDREHRLVFDQARGYCTMEYQSVMGRGRLQTVAEEDKKAALETIMAHYHKGERRFNPAAIPRTAVFKLVVEEMTGKIKKQRQGSALKYE